jgi:putative ABC transport system permease protein
MMEQAHPQPLARQRPAQELSVEWILALPYPVRNMLRRWRGLVGVMIGVGIALGISMTLLGVARANVDYLAADFRRTGADLYVVTEGGKLVPILPSDTPGTIKHARSTLARIRALPEVHSAIGLMSWSLVRNHEGPRRPNELAELVVTMGIEGDPATLPGSIVLDQGRWLRRANEVVLGSKLAREKGLRVGSTIRLEERDFTVVGLGKLRGLGAGYLPDTLAYLDYRAFRDRSGVGDVMSVITVDSRDPSSTHQRIREMGSLTAYTPSELVAEAERVNVSTVVMMWIMILLTLAIAGLFINTILGRSVSERRLEFATLRAIGIPTRTILLTVGTEAVLINAVAAVIGVAISSGLGGWMNAYFSAEYSIESLYAPDAALFSVMLGLALGLGVVSGIFPARQATRVDPVEVLREA